ELEIALKAREALENEGKSVRLVSVPCMDVFEMQSEEYKESVLPKTCRRRIAVEAASSVSWGKYVGLDGAYVTMDGFGASAPAKKLFEKFGFTAENIIAKARTL
ncbi:MAG: transketolase C-terminal domain-containing protein, partial [Oscillospiraceae bacterium]